MVYVPLLNLVVRHDQAELSDSRLDRVPARQTRGEVDVARQAEVRGVENLICAGVVEDGLRVDTGLVGEGAETRDRVVEGRVDLDGVGNQVLELQRSAVFLDRVENSTYLLEHVELVLALDIVGAGHDHAGQKTAKGRDTIALTNAENGGVDVGGTGLEGAEAAAS